MALLGSEPTTFTLDNMGRYLCNTLQEAIDSTGLTVAGKKRDFDVIVIGGGSFGSVVANGLFMRDRTRSRRILVLELGPFVLPEHVQNLPFMGADPGYRLQSGIATRTTTFVNTDGQRGIAIVNGQPAGYIGLQSYPNSTVAFRHIELQP